MARDTLSASDLELDISSFLLSSPYTASEGRNIGDTFHTVITALSDAKIECILAGAIALGLYAPVRFTRDIALIARDASRAHVLKTMADVGVKLSQGQPYQLKFVDPESQIEIGVSLGKVDPEKSAVEDHTTATLFNTHTLVIKPEYLLWIYCVSDLDQHRADAIALINGGKVDMKKLNNYLKNSGDRVAQEQLQTLLAKAERDKKSSYSDSVSKRLQCL